MASGIQIGDAVLKMFVDWTDIDKVASDLPSHLKPGSDAAAALGKSFDVVGSSAAAAGTQASLAGKKIGDAGKQGAAGLKSADEASQGLVARIKALEAESVVLQQQVQQLQVKLQQLGPAGEDAGRRMGRGMNEAAAEAGLLGEAFGIRLPRHVRTFISELPGLSTALSAAFSATAIFFIIEAVVQLGEKITELLEHSKKVEEAWKDVGTASISAGQAMSRAVDESEAKLIGLTEGALAELDFRIRNIAEDSKAAAGEIGKIGDAVTNALTEEQANAFAVAFFAGFKDTSREVAEDAKKFFKQLKDTVDLDGSAKGLEKISQKFADLDVQMKETAKDLKETGSPAQSFFDEDRLKALERFRNGLINVQHDLEKDQSRILLDQTAKAAQQAEEADQSRASNAVRLAKEVLDVRLAAIESTKANEEAAFAEGKINITQWAEAQIKAANDSAGAQIRYKAAIALSAQQSLDAAKAEVARADAVIRKTDTEAGHAAVQVANEKLAEAAAKAHQAAEELANEKLKQQSSLIEAAAKAIAKSKDEAAKLREEWSRQDFGAAKVEDATHALEQLTRAEQRLKEAQTTLKESEITADYSAQEAQVERLAAFSVITEEEKESRLKTLYERERGAAIGALLQQLDEEQAIVDKAQKDFDSASSNPLFPDSQLADLKRNLDQAQIAYDNTHTQIIRVTDQYRQKLEGLTLAERMATAQELARARATQASLAAERAQIATNGGDTSAVDKEIKATKSYETELQRLLTRMTAITKTKPTWDSFFSDLVSRSLKTGEAFKQMASLFADAMSSSVEAAVNGSEGFGEAMAQIVKSTLASLAGAAVGHVLTEIAKASSDFATAASLAADPFTAALAPGFIASAHAHLVAAAEWGAIGAGAAVGGAAIPGGGGSSSSGSAVTGSEGPAAGSTAASAAPQPIQVQNVQHLGEGAVVSKRRLVVVGDDPRGGNQEEGIVPLGNDRATGRIANAILKPLVAAFAGVPVSKITPELVADIVNPQPFTLGTVQAAREGAQLTRQAESLRAAATPEIHHHHQSLTVHVDMPISGVYNDGNLHTLVPKLTKKISDAVQKGTVRLKASSSYRVTKRG